MSEKAVWDKEKGEIRILGHRHTALDAQALCDRLTTLVGTKVAEVVMNNLEFELGKEDAARTRQAGPEATVRQVLDFLIESDRLSGVGIPSVNLPETSQGPIFVVILNPSVVGTVGAAKCLLFSWWAGALSILFGRELEIKEVAYDQQKNAMKCRIDSRG